MNVGVLGRLGRYYIAGVNRSFVGRTRFALVLRHAEKCIDGSIAIREPVISVESAISFIPKVVTG